PGVGTAINSYVADFSEMLRSAGRNDEADMLTNIKLSSDQITDIVLAFVEPDEEE
ncbi:MAG: hypothetical protein JRE23_13645, partial [Deltaproteobacteria bacterium]|nr:hypothetical protein [Deltaproteobacteria bacterium]